MKNENNGIDITKSHRMCICFLDLEIFSGTKPPDPHKNVMEIFVMECLGNMEFQSEIFVGTLGYDLCSPFQGIFPIYSRKKKNDI